MFFDAALIDSVPRLVTPVLLAATGGALCERSGVFNISLEGMMLVGAFAAVAGTYYSGSPWGGLVVAMIALVRHRMTIAERQGLLALATRRSVSQPLSRVLLLRRGWMDAAGNATTGGLSQARLVQRDQMLWDRYLLDYPEDAFACREWSMRFIEEVLPGDLVAELDRRTVEASLRTGGV